MGGTLTFFFEIMAINHVTSFLLIISLTAIFARPSVQQPGLRVAVSQQAIQKAINNYLPQVVAIAKNTVIPGANEKYYKYDDIHFSSFNIGSATNSLSNNELLLALNGISVHVPDTTFHGYYKWHHITTISCKGVMQVDVSNTNMVFSIAVHNQGGKPAIQAAVKSVQFGPISVSHKMHGLCKVADKIIDPLVIDVNKKVKEAITSQVPAQIQSQLNQLAAKVFSQFTAGVKIDKYSEVDFSLVSDMLTTSNVLMLNVKGEFKSVVNPQESTLVASSMPVPVVKSDVGIQINPYVLNTAAEVYTNAGAFSGFDSYSTSSKLNTSLPVIGPLLYKLCPDCSVTANWGILTKASGGIMPVFSIKDNIIYLTVAASALDITLANKTHTLNNVIDAFVNITASATVSINNTESAIVYQVGLEHFEFEIKSSLLPGPPVDSKLFNALILPLLQTFVVPLINSRLHPIPLPSIKEISLVNPSITENVGFIEVQTDIKI